MLITAARYPSCEDAGHIRVIPHELQKYYCKPTINFKLCNNTNNGNNIENNSSSSGLELDKGGGRAILGNADVTEAGSMLPLLQHDYWGTSLLDSGSHGSWRPLCVLSFRLDFHLGHGDAFGFHLSNLLLHCLSTALVLSVAHTLLPTSRVTARVTARVAAALFASHPIHTEAVAGLVGRADLGACICCLLAHLAYHHHMLHSRRPARWPSPSLRPRRTPLQGDGHCGSAALWTLRCLAGIMSIENEYRVCQRQRKLRSGGGDRRSASETGVRDITTYSLPITWHRLRSLTILSIFLLCALCRLCLVPRPSVRFSAADNPTAHESSWWTRTLTFLYLPARNLQLLLLPHRLSFDWGMEAIPRIRTLCDVRNLLSLGCYAALLALTCQAARLCRSCIRCSIDGGSFQNLAALAATLGRQQLLLGVAWIHLCLQSSVRWLLSPLEPWLWQALAALSGRNQRRFLLCCLGLVLSSFSLRTVQRNRDWHNEEQLFGSAVAINPPKALGNLGGVLSSRRRFEEAKLALGAAIRHRPNMADVHFNLGMVHQQQENYSAAVPFYRRAIELRPQLAVAYLNLATSLLACHTCRGRGEAEAEAEAEALLLMGARLRGRGVRDRNAHVEARHSAYQQLSALQHSRGALPQAVQVLQEALSLPQSVAQRAALHQRLAALHVELQQFAAAEEQQQLVLQLQPEQGAHCVHFGQMLARNSSRHAEALLWFQRALQLSPLEASVHHHYADFLEQRERPQEALVYRLRAAALAPHDYALHAAVADALRLLHRLAEAELWYRRAAALHPRSARAHANLGAILQLRGQRPQAVDCYRRALQLQPGHATSLANLAKMAKSGNIDEH
ncbi:hypothetical protein ACLKA6_016875 [Drosophila palustris]